MKNTALIKTLASVFSLIPGLLAAELSVASLFTDNAILQRDMPVPVWGRADPGASVTVKFADQSKTSVADTKGHWQVNLDPIPASHQARKLHIGSPKKPLIELSNILVGEVWICSGQSNMQMENARVPDTKALIRSAKNLRKFTVKQTVAFTEQDHCEGQWAEEIPESAVAFAFAYFLEKAADVPVGIIQASWGSSSIEGWMPRDLEEQLPHFKKIMKGFDANQENREKITTILNGPKPWNRKSDIFLRRQPNLLYNAMMHPLAPYACRGVAWYQGEANANSIPHMLTYKKSLQAWTQRYRKEWQRDDLQFLIVMLPGYAKGAKGGPENPNTNSWAWMRESQLKIHDLPHTAVANTIDLGHLTNIHPTDKLPIGKRLALLAARDTLEQEIEAQGPVFKRSETKGQKIIIHFDHAKGLTTSDGKAPTGFWLADDSKKWVKAQAKISSNSLILHSPELSKPLYVRYAFAGKPKVNLVNSSKLPAYPFRTDRFQP